MISLDLIFNFGAFLPPITESAGVKHRERTKTGVLVSAKVLFVPLTLILHQRNQEFKQEQK